MADNAYQILPRPSLDLRTAAGLADELFGVSGPLDELGSHQDRNFRIVTDGRPAVLKVANRSWGLPAIQAQNAALQHLAARPCRFRAPVPLPGRDGGFLYQPEIDGERLAVRLLSFVDGVPVTEGRMSAALVAELGALAAACSLALADFEHPGLDRAVQWDLQVAASVSRSLLASVPEPVLR